MFHNRNVFILGASGYLGGRLFNYLNNMNCNVYALLRRTSIHGMLVKDKIAYTDENLVEFIVKHNISVVINMVANYGREGESDLDIIAANEFYPLKIIQDCLEADKEIVFINTDTSLPRETNVYSMSKSHFVNYVRLVTKKTKVSFLNIKLEHFFGPLEPKTRFISFLITSFLDNTAAINLTKGEQIRDFIYIDDVLSAYLIILDNLDKIDYTQDLSLGSGIGFQVRELVTYVNSYCNNHNTELNFGALAYRDPEAMYLVADIAKLKDLGWEAKFPLDRALRICIESYRK